MNWRIIFVLFAVYAVGTNALIMAGILPAIAEGLNTTEAIAGLGLTVFALTYAVIGPLLPIILSRFGRRTIMAGGLLLFIGGTVMSGLAPDVATFMLSRVIVAIAAAAIPPQAAAIAIAISPPGEPGEGAWSPVSGHPTVHRDGRSAGRAAGSVARVFRRLSVPRLTGHRRPHRTVLHPSDAETREGDLG